VVSLIPAASAAVREYTATTASVYYLVGDHLGSTSVVTSSDGSLRSRLLYTAWGELRYTTGDTAIRYRFTGQREEAALGLYDYNARFYDPYLNRWTSPDNIIPDPGNSLDWDRYAYSRNNPVKYIDPTGHWVETAFDIAFIAYDLYQMNQEGWTLVNTVALVANVACVIVPIGTDGGTAVRVAMAGGDTAMAFTRVAVQVPDAIRAGQAAEKVFQFIEGSDSNGPNLSNTSGTSNLDTINSVGDPYPEVLDPRTGQPIPAPPNNLKWVPEEQRVPWGNPERDSFIRDGIYMTFTTLFPGNMAEQMLLRI